MQPMDIGAVDEGSAHQTEFSGQAPPDYGTNPSPPSYGQQQQQYAPPAYNQPRPQREEEREPNINQAKYKTKMCANFFNGQCSWGNNCAFAHGEYEMRLGSPNASNSNAPTFGPPPTGSGPNPPPPSYERVTIPPPYHNSPSKAAQGQQTPPQGMPAIGGFPVGGANYTSNPDSPRSPMKISSPTGTGAGQRFRHEPYSALGKAFSSENLHALASEHLSPRGEEGN